MSLFGGLCSMCLLDRKILGSLNSF
uniref:Uncharacterized protein n=1 Tax=Wuchereria bancrofti TaxID=6293 RepID=A0AAF5PSL6_WUCBA